MVKFFKSTHNLPFECAEWPRDKQFTLFRIGTCEGLWFAEDDAYNILSIINKEMGNGHFEDVFDWFLQSCKRDKKILRFREVWNERLKKHLIEKRGFKIEKEDDLILTP